MDRRSANRRNLLSVLTAVALHGLLLAGLLQAAPVARRMLQTPAIPVMLAPRLLRSPPPPPPPPKPEVRSQTPSPKGPQPRASPPPPPAAAAPPRPHLVQAPEARPAPAAHAVVASEGLSDAEIAGAITAGSGDGQGQGGGGSGGDGQGCDMVRRLQQALRRNGSVQAAVARAQGPERRPLVIWRGDWVQSSGEEGKGLAGLRQAISLEVAFAPEACRAEPVRGVVLLSLGGGAGRIALGRGVWRWSDLLFAGGAAPRR